jgi:hypothetical protein
MVCKIPLTELLKPYKITCAKCGGNAWVIPIPAPHGQCLCPECTFGDKSLSLTNMLKKLYSTEK